MHDQKLFLAADSGGSKTVWTLITANGDRLVRMQTAGLAAVQEGLLPVDETVLAASADLRKYGEPCGIYLSLGGPNVGEVSRALDRAWPGVAATVEREAKGDAVLYAASLLGCSAAVMCGTGSVAMGDTKSGRRFAGGWGPVYGDGGSGGGLGGEALRSFLRSVDGMEQAGALASLFSHLTDGLDTASFSGRMELKARALGMSRRELAALAPSIYSFAQNGDAAAAELYHRAAQEIAGLAFSVSDNDSGCTVLLCGGLFSGKPEFVEDCRRAFSEKSSAKILYHERFGPIAAAEAAVLRNHKITVTKELFDKLLNI